jgi:murein DD-endopeptidase MepM/ murein hydrolase activator NlpD
MAQFWPQLSLRVRQLIDRWFPERQFLIRGPGKVTALHLSQRQQVWCAGLTGFILLWSAGATIGIVLTYNNASKASQAARLLSHAANSAQVQLRSTAQSAEAKIASMRAASQAMITKLADTAARLKRERDAAIAQSDQDAAKAAAVDSLTKQVQASIDTAQNIIKSTGLDPATLVPAPPPIPVPANLTASGPLHHQADNQPPNPALDKLAQQMIRLQSLNIVIQHLPIIAPVADVAVTSPYGYRPSPFTGQREFHVGIDLRGAVGTPVYATAPGIVTFAGGSTGYGRLIEIDHGYGLTTRYSHLEKILVTVGQTVSQRQEIALLGDTGWSTGPHLLYETRFDDKPLDPLQFIKVYP